MSHNSPRPESGENADAVFTSLMDGVFPQSSDLADEFAFLDAELAIEEHRAMEEAKVIEYLADKLPEVASLNKMINSLRRSGINYPTCRNVSDYIEDMSASDDYSDYPDEFFIEMVRMDKFASVIEHLAGTNLDPSDRMSVSELLADVVKDQFFTADESEAIVDAIQKFMETEQ